MAGRVGCTLELPGGLGAAAWLFGEDQGRYLLAVRDADAMLLAAEAAGVPAHRVGETGGDALKLSDGSAISVARLKRAHEGWLPAYMAAELAAE